MAKCMFLMRWRWCWILLVVQLVKTFSTMRLFWSENIFNSNCVGRERHCSDMAQFSWRRQKNSLHSFFSYTDRVFIYGFKSFIRCQWRVFFFSGRCKSGTWWRWSSVYVHYGLMSLAQRTRVKTTMSFEWSILKLIYNSFGLPFSHRTILAFDLWLQHSSANVYLLQHRECEQSSYGDIETSLLSMWNMKFTLMHSPLIYCERTLHTQVLWI